MSQFRELWRKDNEMSAELEEIRKAIKVFKTVRRAEVNVIGDSTHETENTIDYLELYEMRLEREHKKVVDKLRGHGVI